MDAQIEEIVAKPVWDRDRFVWGQPPPAVRSSAARRFSPAAPAAEVARVSMLTGPQDARNIVLHINSYYEDQYHSQARRRPVARGPNPGRRRGHLHQRHAGGAPGADCARAQGLPSRAYACLGAAARRNGFALDAS